MALAYPLGRGGDHLWRVDLDEILLEEELAEEGAHLRLDAEDALVGRRAHINDAVVKACVLRDARQLELLDLGVGAASVLELQRQLGHRLGDRVDTLHRELHAALRARGHGLGRHGHLRQDVDD